MPALDSLRAAAEALVVAEAIRAPVRQISRSLPELSPADAYEIQRLGAELKLARGVQQLGYKVGMTTAAAQAGMGTDEPVFGRLMDDFTYRSGATAPTERFMVPRIEMELAFVIGQPLSGADVDEEKAMAAVSEIRPSFELCAFRTETPRDLIDTIADNCASSGLVLGDRTFAPSEIDTKAVAGAFHRNGERIGEGVSSSVMGNPATSLAWLARKLTSQGLGLTPGQIVLSGAFVGPFDVTVGDLWVGDFGALGALQIEFG